jgi:hypothetical protein
VLGRGHLSVQDFTTLLDNSPELLQVELSNYGEMFLNPQLAEILRIAHSRQVVVSGNNGVNLNFASEEALEAVVRYRVRGLTCSIDGATQATYSLYRRNGNLDNVLRNIDRILEHKRRLRSAFPLLFWQFVVFGHNEHEIDLARSLAAERGMEFVPRLSWDAEHSPVKNSQLVKLSTGLGAATRDEFRQRSGVDYTRDICYQLWQSPVVNWDGKLLGCCVNYWGDFGSDAFAAGLARSAEQPRMQQAREMLRGRSPAVPGVPCSTCHQFHSLRESGHWLTEGEVDSHPAQSYLLSLLPVAAPAARFARIGLFAAGEPSPIAPPLPEVQGRLFRFGADTSVLARLPGPGQYVATADLLTPRGWQSVTLPFTAPERPLCTEIVLDLEACAPATAQPPGQVGLTRVPTWIS